MRARMVWNRYAIGCRSVPLPRCHCEPVRFPGVAIRAPEIKWVSSLFKRENGFPSGKPFSYSSKVWYTLPDRSFQSMRLPSSIM